MPGSPSRQAVLALIRATRALAPHRDPRLAAWARAHAQSRRRAYVDAIASGSWEPLAAEARSELGDRARDLAEMSAHQARLSELAGAHAASLAALRAQGVGPRVLSSQAKTRADLEARLTTRGLSSEQVGEALSFLARDAALTPEQRANEAAESAAANLDRLALAQHRALMGATLALGVARFNQHHAASSVSLEGVGEACRLVEARLTSGERAVRDALREGDLARVRGSAEALSRWAAGALFDEVLPQAAWSSRHRRTTAADFASDGRLGLRLGDTTRRLLRAIALGRTLAWVSRWPAGRDPMRRWLKAAAALPYSAPAAAPAKVSVSALTAGSGAHAGSAITIEGVLGPVTIVHRGRKAISSAPVSDGRGRAVTIAIPYIKLDSAGMVPGAYVRVSGIWHTQSKEVAGAALAIDRLNYTALGKTNWTDWTTAELRAVFTPVPHGLAASWTWEPGVDGAGNALRYGVWFPPDE